VRRYLPAARVTGIAGGLHVTVELPIGVDDRELAEQAAAVGLGPVALSSVCLRPSAARSGLVLGYAAQSPHELTRAVRVLAAVLTGT
jgi:GntR family transcriptional regulator/MocR family aminotransferase